ncbi:Zinc finger protein [Tetrabaena socialis]|uniref:Zinc finger protein n=1 Tax=Tetrabaena socialis TaxID=47790 RepID=A0A2J8A2A0_9CHLO|nr:Zinc finger protein [Tetrabaena socialis]|eukprot:PNH06651.1 Zinc finger protein [Tetrabaena socialis]
MESPSEPAARGPELVEPIDAVEISDTRVEPAEKPAVRQRDIKSFFSPGAAQHPVPIRAQPLGAGDAVGNERRGGAAGPSSGQQPKRKKTAGDALRAQKRKAGVLEKPTVAAPQDKWENEGFRRAEYARLMATKQLEDNAGILSFDEVAATLKCSVCCEFAPSGAHTIFSRGGSTAIRRGTFADHLASDSQARALDARTERAQWGTAQDKAHAAAAPGMCALLRAAHSTAKNMQPVTAYVSIAETMAASSTPGVVPDGAYLSASAGRDMMGCISRVLDEELLAAVRRSPVTGIMIDESTDRSVQSHIAFYVTYLTEANDVKIRFLQMENLAAASAEAIATAVMDVLKDNDVDVKNVLSFTSDGCSVMTGCRTGVAKRLEAENAFMVAVTCVAHKLALCVSGLVKDCAELVAYDKLLGEIATYFSKSCQRLDSLKEVQAMLGEPVLVMLKKHNIRWLSRASCVERVRTCLPALLDYFEKEAKDNGTNARSIYEQISSSDFIILTAALDDIMGLVSTLSRLFQDREFSFLNVKNLIDTSVAALRVKYMWRDEPVVPTRPVRGTAAAATQRQPPLAGRGVREALKQLDEGAAEGTWRGHNVTPPTIKGRSTTRRQPLSYEQLEVSDTISSIVDQLTTDMVERFPPSSMGVLSSFDIFHPSHLAAAPDNDAAMLQYGEESFEYLVGFYAAGSFWKPHICELERCGRSNLAKLLQIMLIIQPASAEVERGFSAMNKIKDTQRASLLLPSLDVLMRIAINGPKLREFEEMLPAVLKVWNTGRRVPQRSSHATRPTRVKTHTVEGGTLDHMSGIMLPI